MSKTYFTQLGGEFVTDLTQGENYSYFTFTFLSEENGKENIFKSTGVTSHQKLVHVFLTFSHFHFPRAGKEIGQRMNFCGGDNIFQMDWVHGGKSSKQIILFGEIYKKRNIF